MESDADLIGAMHIIFSKETEPPMDSTAFVNRAKKKSSLQLCQAGLCQDILSPYRSLELYQLANKFASFLDQIYVWLQQSISPEMLGMNTEHAADEYAKLMLLTTSFPPTDEALGQRTTGL